MTLKVHINIGALYMLRLDLSYYSKCSVQTHELLWSVYYRCVFTFKQLNHFSLLYSFNKHFIRIFNYGVVIFTTFLSFSNPRWKLRSCTVVKETLFAAVTGLRTTLSTTTK
jgi:hypothetical protein